MTSCASRWQTASPLTLLLGLGLEEEVVGSLPLGW